MLRVKVTLIYLVLVGLLLGLTMLIVEMNVTRVVRADTEATLERAASAAERASRLDEAGLVAKARFIASGDRLYRALQGEFVKEKAAANGEGELPADLEGERHLDVNEKLTAQKYRLDETAKSETGGVLSLEPTGFDAIFVLDAQGVGVAALGKDLYSWFGADIAKQFPSVREVADGGAPRIEYWMWSFKPADEKRLYRMAIAPVRRSETDTPAGVVVLGTMVNDGLAKKKQAMFSAEGADALEGRTSTDIAFFRGDALVGSTFGSERQSVLAEALRDKGMFAEHGLEEITIGEELYLATSRIVHGGKTPVGVVVLSSLDAANEPLQGLRVDILLAGVAILLIGGFLIFFVTMRFMKPLEDLETGMQELIAGNTDYVWEAQQGHDLQASLANNLNLMSAYLQGKPMPDDEQIRGSWTDLMGGGGGPQRPGKVQGVDLSALSAPPPSKDDQEG